MPPQRLEGHQVRRKPHPLAVRRSGPAEKGETIDKLLYGGYSSISLGYIGLYELTYVMTGQSHTSPEGLNFALQVMQHLKDTVMRWRSESNIGFALYGTPAESLCYRFAEIDRERYGTVKNVTDKGTTPTPTT